MYRDKNRSQNIKRKISIKMVQNIWLLFHIICIETFFGYDSWEFKKAFCHVIDLWQIIYENRIGLYII